MRPALVRLISLASGVLVSACASAPAPRLGVRDSRLAPCPASPNCVSSDATDDSHRVPPLTLAGAAPAAWAAAQRAVADLPRTRIVTRTADYLHAEARSRVFRFVDDLELHLRPSLGIIAVRSASRAGYRDLGVNRRRVERLRARLLEQGVIR